MSEQQINCPYCLFEIPRAASVCGHCTRDISLIRPVLARLNDVDNELSFFKQELSDLKEVIEQDKAKLQNSSHQLLTNIQLLLFGFGGGSPPPLLIFLGDSYGSSKRNIGRYCRTN